jgi:predicted transcriptional regulator
MSLSPEQVRAARNWLAWTQAELANRAKVGMSEVKDYEGGKRTPIATNLVAIQRALEASGMQFTATSVSGPIKGTAIVDRSPEGYGMRLA